MKDTLKTWGILERLLRDHKNELGSLSFDRLRGEADTLSFEIKAHFREELGEKEDAYRCALRHQPDYLAAQQRCVDALDGAIDQVPLGEHRSRDAVRSDLLRARKILAQTQRVAAALADEPDPEPEPEPEINNPLDWSGLDMPDQSIGAVRSEKSNFNGANLFKLRAIRAGFKGSHFSGADLTSACLSEADLRSCFFDGADLDRAELQHARLIDALAIGASFEGAFLYGADCRESDFCGADFSNADVRDCDFRGSVLRGCDFRGALTEGARFENADLTGALGLLL